MGNLDDFVAYCNRLAAELYFSLRDRTGRLPEHDYPDFELQGLAAASAERLVKTRQECGGDLPHGWKRHCLLKTPLRDGETIFSLCAEEEVDFSPEGHHEALRKMVENKFLQAWYKLLRHCNVFETSVRILDNSPCMERSRVYGTVYGKFVRGR